MNARFQTLENPIINTESISSVFLRCRKLVVRRDSRRSLWLVVDGTKTKVVIFHVPHLLLSERQQCFYCSTSIKSTVSQIPCYSYLLGCRFKHISSSMVSPLTSNISYFSHIGYARPLFNFRKHMRIFDAYGKGTKVANQIPASVPTLYAWCVSEIKSFGETWTHNSTCLKYRVSLVTCKSSS